MKFTRLLVAALAAVLCAALLAGCGGGPTKADYEKDMKKVSKTAQKELDSLQEGTPTEEDVETAQKALEDAADDVSDIEPPSEVKDLHEDLEQVLRDTAELMGELKPLLSLQEKDPKDISAEESKKMQEVPAKFAKVQKEMTRVSGGYSKKKYDIGFDQ